MSFRVFLWRHINVGVGAHSIGHTLPFTFIERHPDLVAHAAVKWIHHKLGIVFKLIAVSAQQLRNFVVYLRFCRQLFVPRLDSIAVD